MVLLSPEYTTPPHTPPTPPPKFTCLWLDPKFISVFPRCWKPWLERKDVTVCPFKRVCFQAVVASYRPRRQLRTGPQWGPRGLACLCCTEPLEDLDLGLSTGEQCPPAAPSWFQTSEEKGGKEGAWVLLFGVSGFDVGLQAGNLDGVGRKDIIKTIHFV